MRSKPIISRLEKLEDGVMNLSGLAEPETVSKVSRFATVNSVDGIEVLLENPFAYSELEFECTKVPNPEIFFPLSLLEGSGKRSIQEAAKETEAKKFCVKCLGKSLCLEFALKNGEKGIWGNTNERERDKIKDQRVKKIINARINEIFDGTTGTNG